MNFEINRYLGNKNRNLDFFEKENLVFANIENEETFGTDLLLEGKKWEEEIILIGEKVITDIGNILELPNGEKIIETKLSDYGSFDEVYLTKNMDILKTNTGEIITKLGELKDGLIEVEIQRNIGNVGEIRANEIILGILDKNYNFIES